MSTQVPGGARELDLRRVYMAFQKQKPNKYNSTVIAAANSLCAFKQKIYLYA